MPHISLKKVSIQTYQFLLKKQGEIKLEKKTAQYSLEMTVLKILKDYQDMAEGKKKSPAE